MSLETNWVKVQLCKSIYYCVYIYIHTKLNALFYYLKLKTIYSYLQ
jgi:hypothetical protein